MFASGAMTKNPMNGNRPDVRRHRDPRRRSNGDAGFTVLEMLIALIIMVGAFVSLAGAIPLAAIMHRSALERERALSLAQYELEYFLTNPGPFPGETGSTAAFANHAEFPAGYSGSYAAYTLNGAPGLTLIVVTVRPPHSPAVELSAIDTTYSNIIP